MSYIVLNHLYPELFSDISQFIYITRDRYTIDIILRNLKHDGKYKCIECKLWHTSSLYKTCLNCRFNTVEIDTPINDFNIPSIMNARDTNSSLRWHI